VGCSHCHYWPTSKGHLPMKSWIPRTCKALFLRQSPSHQAPFWSNEVRGAIMGSVSLAAPMDTNHQATWFPSHLNGYGKSWGYLYSSIRSWRVRPGGRKKNLLDVFPSSHYTTALKYIDRFSLLIAAFKKPIYPLF
jgi:hypothetical protein